MTVTAIILAHYKQRENNLKRIINDLISGSIIPDNICVFIDNPEIEFNYPEVTIIRSNKSFLPRVRFALGSYFDTDYCFFIDDDLTVRHMTLENLLENADDTSILGLQGSILGKTNNPYADDTSIKRGPKNDRLEVDVVLRTYFVPRVALSYGLQLQALNSELPSVSLDDVYLSLGNKYLGKNRNYVIGVDENTDVSELSECGVGQSFSGLHYENRNKVCKYLMDKYELSSTR